MPRRRPRPAGPVGVIVAIVSLVIFGIIAAMIFSSGGPSSDSHGPCVGGPATGSTGQPVGHGNYRFPCADGGSTIVHLGS